MTKRAKKHTLIMNVRKGQKPAEEVVPRSTFGVCADPVRGSKEGGSHNCIGSKYLPHKHCDNKCDLILMHFIIAQSAILLIASLKIEGNKRSV